MLDFVLGAVLVVLLVRGWLRGLVREAIGLAVLVVGTILAFRLSEPAGSVIASMAGTSHDISRYAGGIVVFLLVAIGGGIVGYIAHKGVRSVPGLPTMNRAGGAFFAAGAGLLVATVVASVVAVLPPAAPVTRQLEASVIGRSLVDPDGAPQAVLGALSGDHVIAKVLMLQDTVGDPRLVADRDPALDLPAVPEAQLRDADKAELKLLDLVNRSRVDAAAAPVLRSAALDEVAAAVAWRTYQTGRSDGMRTQERLVAAGLPAVRAAEILALGVSPGSVHQAIEEDRDSERDALRPGFTRAGVGAVHGPYGLMAVVVLAG